MFQVPEHPHLAYTCTMNNMFVSIMSTFLFVLNCMWLHSIYKEKRTVSSLQLSAVVLPPMPLQMDEEVALAQPLDPQ